jgi:hypothetical protein
MQCCSPALDVLIEFAGGEFKACCGVADGYEQQFIFVLRQFFWQWRRMERKVVECLPALDARGKFEVDSPQRREGAVGALLQVGRQLDIPVFGEAPGGVDRHERFNAVRLIFPTTFGGACACRL